MFNSCSLGSVRTPLKFHEKGLLPSCAGVRSHWLAQGSRAYLFPAPRPVTCHICSLKSVTEYFHLVIWQVLQIGIFSFLENLPIEFTSMLLPTRIRTLPGAGRVAMEKGVVLSL